MLPVRPGIKRQSMAWCSQTSPRPKKSLQKSKVKTLLIAFFDNKGIIHEEFVPAGQTINTAFYKAILNRLLQRIRRVRPELHRTGKWMCTQCDPCAPIPGSEDGSYARSSSLLQDLRSIPHEAFSDCFRKLYERCKTCVVAVGDYFEGQ